MVDFVCWNWYGVKGTNGLLGAEVARKQLRFEGTGIRIKYVNYTSIFYIPL